MHHPVLDDPGVTTWSQYAVRAWPTLCVVDPEGYLVHVASGEGHAEGLARVVEDLVAVHEARGTLHRGDGPWVPPAPARTALRFPGGLAALPDGTVLVCDTAHHQVVRLAGDLEGAGASTGLTRDLLLAPGEGVLHVAATAASCDVVAEHPACHVTQQDWGVPVRVVDGGPAGLRLVLRGTV